MAKPVTTHEVSGVLMVQVSSSSPTTSTTYRETLPPPNGAESTEMVAEPFPATTPMSVGTAGASVSDGSDVPTAFVTVTMNL